MTDYSKTTDFGVKDGLTTGNANKLVRGSEFDTEFDAIQTAVATKADKASPTFTGTVTGADLTINGTFKLADTSDDHYYTWAVNELTADRTVTMPLLTGNDTFVFQAHTATLTNKTIDLTSNTLQGSKTEFNTALESDTFLMGSDLLDEDTMTSNSATKPASQQSIKAYVDAQVGGVGALVASNNLSDLTNAATARSNLGLVIGTNVQAYDAGLNSISGLTTAANKMIYTTASDTYAVTDLSSFARTLLDDTSQATAAATILSGASLTTATVAATDKVIIQDADASDAVKTVTAQSIADLGGGDYIFLAAATASNSATVEFDNTVFDGTYDEYVVRLINVVPATDNVAFHLRTSTDNGATFDSGATDYEYVANGATTDAAQIVIAYSIGSDTNEEGVCGEINIYSPSSAKYTRIHSKVSWPVFDDADVSNVTIGDIHAQRNAAADVDAIRFYFSSGNIESGKFAVYGIKRS